MIEVSGYGGYYLRWEKCGIGLKNMIIKYLIFILLDESDLIVKRDLFVEIKYEQ